MQTIKILLTLIERRQRQFIIIWCIVWKEMKVEWNQSKSMCWVWKLKYIWEQEYHYVLLLLLTFRFMLFLASFLSSLIISTRLFSLYISLLQNVLYSYRINDDSDFQEQAVSMSNYWKQIRCRKRFEKWRKMSISLIIYTWESECYQKNLS